MAESKRRQHTEREEGMGEKSHHPREEKRGKKNHIRQSKKKKGRKETKKPKNGRKGRFHPRAAPSSRCRWDGAWEERLD